MKQGGDVGPKIRGGAGWFFPSAGELGMAVAESRRRCPSDQG